MNLDDLLNDGTLVLRLLTELQNQRHVIVGPWEATPTYVLHDMRAQECRSRIIYQPGLALTVNFKQVILRNASRKQVLQFMSNDFKTVTFGERQRFGKSVRIQSIQKDADEALKAWFDQSLELGDSSRLLIASARVKKKKKMTKANILKRRRVL